MTAIPTWIVSSGAFWSAGTSGLISRRQARRVEQERQRDADRDEPDRADRVAALEEEVAADHRERERDRELEHVAPRPAPDDDAAQQQRRPEGERSATSVSPIAARDSGLGEAKVSRPPAAERARSVDERAGHDPGEGGLAGPVAKADERAGRWRASPRGRRGRRSRARRG